MSFFSSNGNKTLPSFTEKVQERMPVFFTLAYLYVFALPKEFELKLKKNNDFSSEIFASEVLL